jgi:hypothetical protein
MTLTVVVVLLVGRVKLDGTSIELCTTGHIIELNDSLEHVECFELHIGKAAMTRFVIVMMTIIDVHHDACIDNGNVNIELVLDETRQLIFQIALFHNVVGKIPNKCRKRWSSWIRIRLVPGIFSVSSSSSSMFVTIIATIRIMKIPFFLHQFTLEFFFIGNSASAGWAICIIIIVIKVFLVRGAMIGPVLHHDADR